MPDGEKTVTEYRLIGTDEKPGGTYYDREAVDASVVRCDREWPEDAPHRVQSRTVTTTEWEDCPDA